QAIRELVPRAQYSAGKGSTVAGLTVAVVRDELSGGGFTAQAGALVLADGSILILDDADKLEPEDFQALNEALEDGSLHVHKGGINQKFSTRCSVIALCNPKKIRFDDYKPLFEQIGIPADTLSRFDLIFKIQDVPDPVKDRLVSEHQARQWARYENNDGNSNSNQQDGSGLLSQGKLSKYLQFAKTFRPRTTPEVRKLIVDYYLSLRKMDITKTISTTPRQNNGVYRLVKAVAKLRLSDECTMEDVRVAIEIHAASLEVIRDPTSGKIDVDILHGMGKSQRERIKLIMGAIRTLQGSNGGTVPLELITQTLEAEGIKKDQIEDAIGRLKTSGDIIEHSAERYRVV
ncbi:MAG: ATP-binding protein, partial [bacterium]